MAKIAIIGGTGLDQIDGMKLSGQKSIKTPYGDPSSHLLFGHYGDSDIIFLNRHGDPHTIPPHRVNYRANIWALKECGIDRLIAINAVGGITGEMAPTCIAIPDQIIDYTWGRDQTFFDNDNLHLWAIYQIAQSQ
jgi:purine nucleoside phosphorylase